MLGRRLDAGQADRCWADGTLFGHIGGVCICQVRLGPRVDSLCYFPTNFFLPLLYSLGRRLDAGQAVRCWAGG